MTFANTISLDAVYDVNLGVVIGMTSEDEYDLFDSGRGGLFEDAKAILMVALKYRLEQRYI